MSFGDFDLELIDPWRSLRGLSELRRRQHYRDFLARSRTAAALPSGLD
jgi:hypothetical protein